MFYDNSKELERITELEEQYAAAQRALDAEREKVKALDAMYRQQLDERDKRIGELAESAKIWMERRNTLQAQLRKPILVCQRCGRVSQDGWVPSRYECDELNGSLQCPDCQCIDLETNTAKELASICTQAQAQLADRDAMILQALVRAAEDFIVAMPLRLHNDHSVDWKAGYNHALYDVGQVLAGKRTLDAKDAPLTDDQRAIRDCCETPHDCKWGGLGGCGYEGRKYELRQVAPPHEGTP